MFAYCGTHSMCLCDEWWQIKLVSWHSLHSVDYCMLNSAQVQLLYWKPLITCYHGLWVEWGPSFGKKCLVCGIVGFDDDTVYIG